MLDARLTEQRIPHEDVTSRADVEFRIIHYEPKLFMNPYLITFEFPVVGVSRSGFTTARATTDQLFSSQACRRTPKIPGEEPGSEL